MASSTLWLFLASVVVYVICAVHSVEDHLIGLKDDNFEHLTQASTGATTGDWIVLFTASPAVCKTCKESEQVFGTLASRIHMQKNVAVVNAEESQGLVKRFKLTSFPRIMLFRLGFQYKYNKDINTESLEEYVEEGFKDAAKEAVTPPPSDWDEFMENIKAKLRGCPQTSCCMTTGAVVVVALIGLVLLCKPSSGKTGHGKTD